MKEGRKRRQSRWKRQTGVGGAWGEVLPERKLLLKGNHFQGEEGGRDEPRALS